MKWIVQACRQRRMFKSSWGVALFSLLVLFLVFCFPCKAQALWPLTASHEVSVGFHESYSIDDVSFSHYGVDLAAPAASTVLSAVDGTVSFIGAVPVTGRIAGQTMQAVSVTMSDGRIMTFMPFEEIAVSTGDAVDTGAVLGVLASSGDSSCGETHLHVGLKRGGTYYDPLELLDSSLVQASQEREGTPVVSDEGGALAANAPEYTAPVDDAVFANNSAASLETSGQSILLQEMPEARGEEQGSTVSSGGVRLDVLENKEALEALNGEQEAVFLGSPDQGESSSYLASLIAKAQKQVEQIQALFAEMEASGAVLAACLLMAAVGLLCAGLVLFVKRSVKKSVLTLYKGLKVQNGKGKARQTV